MPRNVYQYLKWFCDPKNITPLTGDCLFMVSVLLVGFMGAYFNNVIIDNRVLNENPIFKMFMEADAFIKHLKENVSGHILLNDYQWLYDFKMLIRSNCHIIPDSLKYLRLPR